jgi:hypothetical protein
VKAALLVIGLLCIPAFAPGTNRFEQGGQAPPTQDGDGKFRKIKVKVNRKGLKVRARKGYFAPLEEEPQSK